MNALYFNIFVPNMHSFIGFFLIELTFIILFSVKRRLQLQIDGKIANIRPADNARIDCVHCTNVLSLIIDIYSVNF